MDSELNCDESLVNVRNLVQGKRKRVQSPKIKPQFTDSSDESMEMILEAVDTTFLYNEMFKRTSETVESGAVYKSQCGLASGSKEDSDDLKVPPAMQQFLAKKLSNFIQQKYVYTDFKLLPHATLSKDDGFVKLFRNSIIPLKPGCKPSEHVSLIRQHSRTQKKFLRADYLKKKDEIRSVCVDYEFIQSQQEIMHWAKSSEKGKLYRYKPGKRGVLEFVEPENEYTRLRKKWSEQNL